MKKQKKLKLKKFYLHPATTFLILIVLTVLISGILSAFQMQATYSKLGSNNQLEKVLVAVENMCNYDGLKYIMGNAVKNLMSFTPLSSLLIALLGLSVAKSSGFLDVFIKKVLSKWDNKKITFVIILLSIASSLINEIGYVILIPLSALIFMGNNRNPLAGIIAAFSGVSFGYGATLFVGSMEVNLNKITENSARLIDPSFHVSLTSNLYIIIFATIILSIIGTIIMEKIVIPKLGRYQKCVDINSTQEMLEIDLVEEEQKKLEESIREKAGMKNAIIVTILTIFFTIYMLIPGLPFSGLLLDTNEVTYLGQLFGENSPFQDGFNIIVSFFFLLLGLAYGIGAKTIKNDRDVLRKSDDFMDQIGSLIVLIFLASQLLAIVKKTNIATIIIAWGANIINSLPFTGIALILLIILVIMIVSLFSPTPLSKWTIMAPVVVPKMMQANISPQFSQFILRASDSMTKGITPMLGYFVIYIGYMNIYNQNKKQPITFTQSIKALMPMCILMTLTWIVIIFLWYITGLPLGPNVRTTL